MVYGGALAKFILRFAFKLRSCELLMPRFTRCRTSPPEGPHSPSTVPLAGRPNGPSAVSVRFRLSVYPPLMFSRRQSKRAAMTDRAGPGAPAPGGGGGGGGPPLASPPFTRTICGTPPAGDVDLARFTLKNAFSVCC